MTLMQTPTAPTMATSSVAIAPVDAADINRKSVRGGAVTVASQGATVAVQLIATIALARLIGPKEYGVVAMVLAVTSFAGLFRDLGLASSTIQRDQLTHVQLSTLFWLNIAVGASLTMITAVASPLVAWFYNRQELTTVTLALSLTFLMGSFGAQPGALLTRQMRFGRLATANLTGTVAGSCVSIAMALRGYSYWSLVAGSLVGTTATSILLNVLCGWRPGMPTRGSGIQSMLRYGANITAFDFVNYFHRNLDNILIGRFWGADALGLYSRAYQLLMLPITHIRGPINAVAFPAMCRMKHDPLQYRVYFQRVAGFVAMTSMPLAAFLFVTSEAVLQLTLGQQWLGASSIFSALAITAFIQPSYSMVGLILLSSGQSQRYLTLGIFNSSLTSVAFLGGTTYGPFGIAVSYAVASYIIAAVTLRWATAGTSIQPRDFCTAVIFPACASTLAVAGCLITDSVIDIAHPAPTIALHATVFLIVFAGMLLSVPSGRRITADTLALVEYLRRTPSHRPS